MDKIFYWVAFGFAGLVGAFGKLFNSRLSRVEEDLSAFRVHVPDNYVKRVDLRELRDEIMSAFDRIYDKLDDKQDKK